DKAGLTDSANTLVNPAPVVDHLLVKIGDKAFTGGPTNVTVAAVDASGHLVPSYAGTVTLTSTDTAAVLPASFTFSAPDQGIHTFQVTFNTTGPQKVTATDKNALTGSASTTVLAAPVADHLVVKLPSTVFAGAATNVTVAAVDASGNTL